jgi:amidophosphoribosyltransferase
MSKIEECAFELSYIKKEYEISKGEIIASKRVNLGQLLGKTHPVDADFIVPIPETAIHYAQGYAHETNTPLCHAIFKKKPKQRTLFLPHRTEVIKDVFAFMPKFFENKKIVLIDETIISGLSLSTIINAITEFKPKEIHLRLGCPPMSRKCPSNNFGDDWMYEGQKLFENDIFTSVEWLSVDQLSSFAKCSYCFGGLDDYSKLVEY